MEQESQMIQGTVLAVIYQNPENGYCVLKVRTEQGEAVTVVGVIPMCVVGERLAIVGRWTRHQSFGQQFEAEFLERLMPETTSEILAFLSSRAVKGIGPKMAEKIVSRFGEKSLNVLEQDPMQLTQIPGISEKKAQEMSESFQKQSGIRRLIEFLTIYHLPAQLAVRLYRAYGELAQEALHDDPYLLTDSYYRADFSQVDAFAIALGVSADDERRVEAGILFELSYNLGAGHTFIPQDKLRTATCALLDLDGEMIDAGMLRLQEQGRMELSQIAGLTACYLPELYEAETYVCRRILSMADGEYPEPGRIDDLVAELLGALSGQAHRCEYDGLTPVPGERFCHVPVTHRVTLGRIVALLRSFRAQPETLLLPDMPAGSLEKKLYSTYLSYLPQEKIAFPLQMNADARGSFTELLKTRNCGQFSVNITKPGVTKGQHWHNSKWEFFIVVAGHGLIRERRLDSDEVLEFEVSGERIEAVHMLPGYTHSITNLSDTDTLVTVMWANECFDPNRPDTYFEEV